MTPMLCALAVSGCGGSSSTSASAVSTPSLAQTSSLGGGASKSFTVTLTRTVTTPTPTTTASPRGAACTAADLAPVFLGQNGATGNVILEVALRNRGTSSCHTFGYPGVEFFSQAGAALPTASTPTTQDILGSTRAREITLAPRQQASFRLIVPTDSGGGGNCPTAGALEISAPNDTVGMLLSIPNGAYECGKTSVSPLLPGNDAVPGV